mmetsp:Transcript_1308/g.1259  ORF Transcript_1308/g.1259 Transcript_1308/m.1259 type:complete len:98 (+) Transcript_1308:1-294(+)
MTDNLDQIIVYDRLVDSEIGTHMMVNDSGNKGGVKEKSGIISIHYENIEGKGTRNSLSEKNREKIETIVSEADIYNINYKLKAAANQITELVKQFNS